MERPILFSAPMVRAILEGRKTQTRRVVKDSTFKATKQGRLMHEGEASAWCPYGRPGDRLWVRETWAWGKRYSENYALTLETIPKEKPEYAELWYRADGEQINRVETWRPSIHMPRWASRINLEVTGIRVERLQGISEEDAIKEGALLSTPSINNSWGEGFDRACFRTLWESINGPGSWEANPWVWVVEFRQI